MKKEKLFSNFILNGIAILTERRKMWEILNSYFDFWTKMLLPQKFTLFMTVTYSLKLQRESISILFENQLPDPKLKSLLNFNAVINY